jgi:16S rRNA G966 N2-methylase RsmD
LGDEAAVPVKGDVFKFLASIHEQFDFIFADPPYTLPNIADLPDLVLERDLLSPEGVFVLEHGKANDFKDHPYHIDHRSYGSVNFSFFQVKS